MSGAVSGIDHLVLLVSDLDAAERRWRKLGFALSPRGYHDRIGTANHLAGLRSGYLELLGIHVPTEANQVYANAIAHSTGAWGIALRGAAHAAFERLCAAGVPATPPQKLTRPVQLRGTTEIAEFHLTHIAHEFTPGAMCFICEHKTPGLVWQEEWTTHANTARRVAGITYVGSDPALIRNFETLSGNAAHRDAHGDPCIALGTQSLRFMDAATFVSRYALDASLRPATEPHIGSISLEVESLKAAQAVASQSGMPVRTLDAQRIALVDEADRLIIELATAG